MLFRSPVLRKRFIVEVFGGAGIEAEIELILPAEFESGFAKRIVALLRSGMTFGQVGRMGSNLVSDDSVLHVFLICKADRLSPY